MLQQRRDSVCKTDLTLLTHLQAYSDKVELEDDDLEALAEVLPEVFETREHAARFLDHLPQTVEEVRAMVDPALDEEVAENAAGLGRQARGEVPDDEDEEEEEG